MKYLKQSISLILVYVMLVASLPISTLAATPVAVSFATTASVVGNKAITLQGSDSDGTALTFALLSQPSHGAISNFNGSSGALVYTPAFAYTGADSFTYKVSSGGQDSNTATVSITVAADKTRIVDYITDAGGAGISGTVTFILTAQASAGSGLISPASSVSAISDPTGKYDISVIASINLNPKTYYQVYFQSSYADRRLLGIFDIPVSATPIVLQPYKVTDTNLAARYTFADKASVDSLQTANANAVFQSLLPAGIDDGRVIGFDAGTGRMKSSSIRETSTRVELSKPLGNVTADNISAANVTVTSITGNGAGLTGITGATGGVNNLGSTTVGADSDANGVGVIDETVGNVTIKRTYADRIQLYKPLELPNATYAQIAAMPSGTLVRANDRGRDLVLSLNGRAVSLNRSRFNVQEFGAGPGVAAATNTSAIQDTFTAAAAARLSYQTSAGLYAGSMPVVEFPQGNVVYEINATIDLVDAYVQIEGNQSVLKKASSFTGTAAFSRSASAWLTRIEGMQFDGFTDGIVLNSSNLDNGMIQIRNCSFFDITNDALSIEAQSSIVIVERNRFNNSRHALKIVASDKAEFRDNWVHARVFTVDRDAAILNYGSSLRVEGGVYVPVPQTVAEPAWINNYDTVRVDHVRWGGEAGSMTIVNNYAGADITYPVVPTGVSITDSANYHANPAYAPSIRLFGLPNFLRVKDCIGFPDQKVIDWSSTISNLTRTSSVNTVGAVAGNLLVDVAGNAFPGGAAPLPLVPIELHPYVIQNYANPGFPQPAWITPTYSGNTAYAQYDFLKYAQNDRLPSVQVEFHSDVNIAASGLYQGTCVGKIFFITTYNYTASEVRTVATFVPEYNMVGAGVGGGYTVALSFTATGATGAEGIAPAAADKTLRITLTAANPQVQGYFRFTEVGTSSMRRAN